MQIAPERVSTLAIGESKSLEFKAKTGTRCGVPQRYLRCSTTAASTCWSASSRKALSGAVCEGRAIEGVRAESQRTDPPSFLEIDRVSLPTGLKVTTVRTSPVVSLP